MNKNHQLRNIPRIDRLVTLLEQDHTVAGLPRTLLADAAREAVSRVRAALKSGEAVDVSPDALAAASKQKLRQMSLPSLRRVINATGVVLHTNLGRAPLSKRAQAEVAQVTAGYSTLEYQTATGERGDRHDHVARRINSLTGAEDVLVVNNNAAAVLLVLSGLAQDKEVLVSRGQLVEVGGSFRIPDVMKQSGAKLIEVGATNKTRLSDYREALGPNTGAILKVHTSNYRIIGFTEQPDDRELVALAKEHNIPVIDDLGSGTLLPLSFGGWNEPAVSERIAAGMDVVTFSGDKLLGGAQAGIIVGKKQYINTLKRHPLLRAVRIDKLTLAALEGTLLDYQTGNPLTDVPALHFLHKSAEILGQQAEQLHALLKVLRPLGWYTKVVALMSQAGGGAFPGADLPSWGVRLTVEGKSPQLIDEQLRKGEIPVICRVQGDAVLFDVRCLSVEDMECIRRICLVLAGGGAG